MTTQLPSRERLAQIIEAADVVLTALAGTSDEIHPEDSTKMVSAWDWLNDNMAPPAVVKQLASFALAAHEQEPVFFVEIEGDDWVNAGRIEGKERPDLGLLPDGINYLYAHPAPELTAIVDRLNLSGYEHEDGEVTPQNAAAVVDILLQQLDEAVQGRDTHPAPSIPAAVPDSLFEEWFEAIEAGDDENWKKPEYLSKEWHEYLARHQLALGAFQFCRTTMLQAEPDGRDYRAIVERISEIMHGSVTDVDLLTVTVLSMKQRTDQH